MPGVALPALDGSVNRLQAYPPQPVKFLHLHNFSLETPDIVPPETAMRGKYSVAKVIDAFRDGYNKRLLRVEAEPLPGQKFREAASHVPQPFLVVVKDRDVVHIAEIGTATQSLLGVVIQIIQ